MAESSSTNANAANFVNVNNTTNRDTFMINPMCDPLYHTDVKLFIKDIHNLKHSKHKIIDDKSGMKKEISVFYYGKSNRPMRSVDMIGIVRAIDIKQKFIKYYLDDGSATIACTLFLPEARQEDGSIGSALVFSQVSSILNKFNISELVRIIGGINEYMGIKGIVIRQMYKIEDPNEELHRWIEIIELKKSIYCRVPHYLEQELSFDKSSAISTNKVPWHNMSEYGKVPLSSNNTDDGDDAIQYNALQPSTVETQYDEKALKRHIKEYINDNELNEFRFSRIVEVPGLQEFAIKVLQLQGRRDIVNSKKRVKTIQGENNNYKQYREEIRDLFKKILKSLVRDENYLQSDQNLISFVVKK